MCLRSHEVARRVILGQSAVLFTKRFVCICRVQSSQLPTDTGASSITEIPPVLPSDVRDEGSSSKADKENAHIASNGASERQTSKTDSGEAKHAVDSAIQSSEQPASRTAFKSQEEAAAATGDTDQISTRGESPTAGSSITAVSEAIQTVRQGSLGEVAMPDAGPTSPTSPFAAADTGHLTVDGDEAELPQLKGAAAAVAHARRKSLGEELPELSGMLLFSWHTAMTLLPTSSSWCKCKPLYCRRA